MEQQDKLTSEAPQRAFSREELEQHVRARAWKDDTFRQEFLANPKAVLERDYAQYFYEDKIPSELSIKVIEEEEQTICFVLPPKLSDDQLSALENIDDEELLGSVAGGVTGNVCVASLVVSCIGTSYGCGCTRKGCAIGKKIVKVGKTLGKIRP